MMDRCDNGALGSLPQRSRRRAPDMASSRRSRRRLRPLLMAAATAAACCSLSLLIARPRQDRDFNSNQGLAVEAPFAFAVVAPPETTASRTETEVETPRRPKRSPPAPRARTARTFEQQKMYEEIVFAPSASEVLELCTGRLRESLDLTLSTACFTRIADTVGNSFEELAQGSGFNELIDFQERQLREDAAADHSNVLPATARSIEKLRRAAPQIRDRLLPAVSESFVRHVSGLIPMQANKVLAVYTRLREREHGAAMISAYAPYAIRKMRQFGPTMLSNMTWTLAVLEVNETKLLDSVVKTATSKMPMFPPGALRSLLWSLATMQEKRPQLFEAAASLFSSRAGLYSATDVSTIAWSFAVLRERRHKEFLKKLMREACWKIHKLTVSELAQVLWSAATLEVKGNVWKAGAKAVLEKIEDFGPAELSITLWAYATSGQVPSQVDMDEANVTSRVMVPSTVISRALAVGLDSFGQQELTNLVWAVASLRYRNEGFMDEAAKAVIAKVDEITPQGLGLVAWAYAKLGIRNLELLSAISRAAKKQIFDFDPQGLANTAEAFARLVIPDEELLKLIVEASIKKADRFMAFDWRSVISACDQAGMETSELFTAMTSRLDSGDGWDRLGKKSLRALLRLCDEVSTTPASFASTVRHKAQSLDMTLKD